MSDDQKPSNLFDGLLKITLHRADITKVNNEKHENEPKDYFVVITVYDSKKTKVVHFESNIQKDTSKPVWDEEFQRLVICEGPLTLNFYLLEKRFIDTVEMGTGSVVIGVNESGPGEAKFKGTFEEGVFYYSIHYTQNISPLPMHTEETNCKPNEFLQMIHPKYDTFKYEDVAAALDTGDIILFHGVSSHSKLEEVLSASYWSHSCILVRNPSEQLKEAYNVQQYYPIAESAGSPLDVTDPIHNIYVFESDYFTIDLRTGGGVQLVPLKCWLIKYEEKCRDSYTIIRRLKLPERIKHLNLEKLEKFMHENVKKKFETLVRQSSKSIWKKNHKEDLSSFFCSELVAATLRSMELLAPKVNVSNFTPNDFDKVSYQTFRIVHKGEDFELEKGALMDPFRIIFNESKHNNSGVVLDVLCSDALPPKNET